MTNNPNNIDYQNSPNNGKVIAGIILLALGGSLLLKQLDIFFFPSWLFSLPTGIIVLGLYLGAKHNFRNSSWVVLVLVGFIFLSGRIVPGFHAAAVFWPVAIITFGVWLIIKRNSTASDAWNKKQWNAKWEYSKYDFNKPNPFAPNTPNEPIVDYTVVDEDKAKTEKPADEQKSTYTRTGDEHLDAVSVFGGVKKIIFSKDFQGGEIVNIFGGAEIDLTQADINGRVYIELVQIFGGTKIIVPSHWTVISDMAAIFAGFDDKRVRTAAPLDTTKVLVIKGTSVFGGTDIRSY